MVLYSLDRYDRETIGKIIKKTSIIYGNVRTCIEIFLIDIEQKIVLHKFGGIWRDEREVVITGR